MAITLRDSFIDVRITEDELKEHVLDVIKARPTGAERRSAIAYLRQIVQKDARDIAQFQYINARAKQVLEERERLHTFDIRSAKHASLFTTASNVNYATLLASANAEVIADGQTIASGLSITGDNASLHGIGTGSAVDGTLVCGCTVNGTLSIDADGVLIEGPGGRPQDRRVRRGQPGRRVPELHLRRLFVHRHRRPPIPGLSLLPRTKLLRRVHHGELRN